MTPALRSALALVTLCAPLVPRARRAAWRQQWRGDLWHYAQWLDRHGDGSRLGRAVALLARTAGCLPHAVTLRTDAWRLPMLSHDVRCAWRSLSRRPAFALVAVLILGLGIGANATIFSWVESIILQPLPGVDSSRLFAMHGRTAARDDLSFSYPNFTDLRAARPDGIEDLVAFRGLAMNLRAGGEPRRVWGQMVTPNFFDVLRVRPLLGRGFVEADGAVKDREPVAVLTFEGWQRIFAGDPAVVGRAITLNGRPFTVVGVAPEGFRGTMIGMTLDVFVPITMQRAFMSGDRLPERGGSFLQVYGRLAGGATLAQAQASLDVAAARLAQDHPVNEGRGITIEPVWRDGAAGVLLPVMATLMAVVGVVLLIACANLAGLLLARAAGRQREVAVRLAVGASRGRLVRQFLAESLLLALGGGLAGILLAGWTSGLLMALMPPTPFPIDFQTGLSLRVVLFSIAVTVAAALAFGVIPALRASKPDVSSALKDAAAAAGGGPVRTRMRSALVVAQVAMSLLLLVCAALFTRGLAHAARVDRGFSLTEGVMASIDLLPNGYDRARGNVFRRQVLERVTALSGVESAAFAAAMPLDLGGGSQTSFEVPGYTPSAGEEIEASYNQVSEHYFATMGIPLVAGRGIDERDGEGRPAAIVVNETMARKYWPGVSPVGRTIRMGDEEATIVGVARDGKYGQISESPKNFLYLPLAQYFRHDALLLVRTSGDAAAVIPSLSAEVRRVDPDLPLFDVRTVSEHLRIGLTIPRMASRVLALFGGLALLLAVVGLYSVVAFSVAQRTREIGVRVALGASPRGILRMVLAQAMRLTLIGLAIGGALAALAAQALRSQLMGIAPTDLVSFAGTTALLLAVAILASVLPARRAAGLDPVSALRR